MTPFTVPSPRTPARRPTDALSRWSALAATLALAGAAILPAPARAQAGGTLGNEFMGQKAGKLATTGSDYLCENLYDSANPVGMLLELGLIVGPMVVLRGMPEISGMTPDQSKVLFDDLRRLARTKIWLPVSAEAQLGDWLHTKYTTDGEALAETALNVPDRKKLAEVKATLAALTAVLPADSPYKFQLHVVKGEQANASIGVGGYVYVTQGLLRDRSLKRDDVALRLAHEIAHLTRRHALKDLQLKLVDLMEIRKDVRSMLNVATNPLGTAQSLLATASATQLLFQRFEQNQELEGDACGMFVLQRTPGFDAAAALKAYVMKRPPDTSKAAWDTSHPPHEEREYVMALQLDPEQRDRAMQMRGGATATAGPPTGFAPGAAPAAGPGAAPATAPTPSATPPSLGGLFDKLKSFVPSLPASAPAQPGTPP